MRKIIPLMRLSCASVSILIFLLALCVRLYYLAGIEAYPRFEHIKNRLDDQVVFDRWAKSIVAGERFDYATSGHEFAYWAAQSPGVYPQAPLYPFFVATCYRLFGFRYDLVRATQMLLGAASCALLYLLARRFLSRPTAALCGLAAAFYGPFVFYEGTLLRAGLFTFVAVAGLLLLMLAAEASPRRLSWLSSAAGLALSAGVLLRPNYLLVAIMAAGWLYRMRAGERPRARRSLAWLAAAVVIPLLPVVAVNSARGGSPAFLSSNGPYILFVGNVHDAPGTTAGTSPYYRQVKASAPAGEVDLVREVLTDVSRHPGAFLRLQVKKAVYFFSAMEIPNNLSYAMARETNPRLAFAGLELYLLLPLALVGLAVSLRRPQRYLLLYLFGFGYWAATVAFYVLSRLRQPVVPVLLIFAGVALEAWWRALGAGRWRLAGGSAIAVLVATVGLKPAPAVHRNADYQMAAAAYVSVAEELERAGSGERARRSYARGLALNPDYREALERLAVLDAGRFSPPGPEVRAMCEQARAAAEVGETSVALKLLERAAELAPGSALPYRYLSNVHYLAGDSRRAMRALEAAVEREPLHELDRRNLKRLRRSVASAK